MFVHKGENETHHTSCQHGGGGMMIWAPCSDSVNHEFLCIQMYSRVRCEAISPTAKAQAKLSHTHDNDTKNSAKSLKEWLKKKRIKVVQCSSQSRPQPD